MWHTFSAGIYPNVAGADARTNTFNRRQRNMLSFQMIETPRY